MGAGNLSFRRRTREWAAPIKAAVGADHTPGIGQHSEQPPTTHFFGRLCCTLHLAFGLAVATSLQSTDN